MTKEKNNNPRSQSSMTSFPDSETIREQAEQKAGAIALPDLDNMTHEEIRQMVHEMKVKQIEADLQIEHLRSGEENDDQASLFSIVTENMLDMVALTDMEGNFTFAGKSHEVLGYEPAFLIGKNVMDFVHPEDLPRILEEFAEFVASGLPRKVEYRYRCKDGSHVWLETAGNLIKDENGAPQTIVFSSRDITERKQAEEALQRKEHDLRESQRIAHVGSWRLDVATNQVVWTEELYNMYGFDPSLPPPPYTEHMELFTPESWERLSTALAHTRETGIPYTLELETIRKDGSNGWMWVQGEAEVDSAGKAVELWGAAQDITERKQAEEALQERLSYEQLLSRVSVLAMETDDLYVFQNKCLTAMGETLDLSRIYIFEHHYETVTMDNTFEWVAEGVSPQKDELQGVSAADIPWWMEVLKSNQVINFADIEAIPDEGVKTILRPQRILSILVVPLFTAGQYYGFLGFDDCVRHREWSDTDAELLQAVGRIITGAVEQKRTKDALKESEELLDATGFMARVGGWQLDVETMAVTWTKETYHIHEVPLNYKPLLDMAIEFFHPDDRDVLSQAIQRALDRCEPYDMELRFITAKGNNLWTRTTCQPEVVDGKKVRLRGTFQDITEGKNAEQQLKESEERFSKAFRSSPAPQVISDITTGEFIDVNDRWVDMLGYSREQSIGRTSKEVGIWADPSERDRIIQKLQENTYFNEEPIEFRTSKGSTVYALWSAETVILGGCHVMLSMIYDETERKQAEKEQERLQAQLAQAQKIESVGRLAGGVAHDFNNMLTIINGYAEMMADVLPSSDPMYASVQEIHDAGKRSAVIVRKLLAFARKQTIAPVPMNLNDSVSGMFKMLHRLIGENIDLLWNPSKDIWLVKMDFSQIDQILANLVVNARDAISDTGKITIESQNFEFDEQYCADHTGFVPGQFVMLAVSDNGCGMDKHVLDNLFEPFFTTKEIGQGTGLGMPTVYGIIKQNNGFVNVYSEPGQGTTVKIYFPRFLEEDAGIPEKKQEEALPKGLGETILVLEDETVVLNLSRIMLERLGYKVIATNRPGEAMESAKAYDGKIDLLLTDIVMPEMNGRDFSTQLIQMYPDVKTLYMSGYTADVIAHHGVLDEDVLFIQKPFSMHDLAVKVREAIEQE